MSQITLYGATDIDLDGDEAKRYEVWYTPAPVVRQYLWSLRHVEQIRDPYRILDPSAGTGVFGAECRRLWPSATIVGVEPRDEVVNSAYDEVTRGRFEEIRLEQLFGLVVTNPPFSLVVEFVERARPLLTDDGLLSLLLPRGWWQRGTHRHAWMTTTENAPVRERPVGGTIGFRGGSSADVREYSWFEWRKEARDSVDWPVVPLPMLPGSDRRWTSVPGRE